MSTVETPEKRKPSTPAGPCPYCSAMVDLGTSSKKKCPSCGEQILSRTDPGTKAKILVTVEGAAELKQKDEGLRAINFALKKMYAVGYTEEHIYARQRELVARDGKAWSVRDAIWAIACDRVEDCIGRADPVLPYVYLDMARFKRWEGGDDTTLMIEATELLNKVDDVELRRKGIEPFH